MCTFRDVFKTFRKAPQAGLRSAPVPLAAFAFLITAHSGFTQAAGADSSGKASTEVLLQRDIEFPVSFPAAKLSGLTEWGQLSSPGPTQGRALLILLSGNTYDHNYWNLPNAGQQYSFTMAANRAGFATLNLDRIGLGNSSKPPANLVTNPNEADTIHQIITKFKTGDLSYLGFGKIILISHSGGYAVATDEALTYNDVDGLVISGFTHAAGPFVSQIVQIPASADPRLAPFHLPTGYLTNQPGERGRFYYNPPDADPAVIAEDESLRTTVTTGELSTESFSPLDVTTPVLTISGAQDRIFTVPGALPQAEAEYAFYPNAASQQTIIVPNAGHSIQLALNAAYTDDRILSWIKRIVAFGDVGGDLVEGGPDNDILAGDGRGKVIFGGSGDDTIIGVSGANVLSGGPGADQFIIGPKEGNDLILDFNGEAGDRLVIDPSLTFTIEPGNGAVTVIRLSNGGVLTLLGVKPDEFQTVWIVRS